jgi:bla regulator protein BlaR1
MTLSSIIDAVTMLAIAYVLTIAIIVLVRPLVTRIAGTNWAYALWGVLLVPPLAVLTPSTITEGLRLWTYPMASVSAPDLLQGALLGIWLVGVVVLGSLSMFRSMNIRRQLEDSFDSLSAAQMLQVHQSCTRANVFPPPITVTSSLCTSPAVMSGLSPKLVLPDDFFLKYSCSERNLVLHHELVHLQRFDLVWNTLFRALRCLLWFVPFIKHCEKMFRSDQERSCDHSVVCDETGSSRAEYAQALYKTVASSPVTVGISGFRNNRHELLLRTELLGEHRRSRTRSLAGVIALAVCVLLSVSVSANPSSLGGSAIPDSGWCSVYGRLGL